MAKNATMSDYRKATGFEALMGYLYLKDEFERLVELVKTGIEEMITIWLVRLWSSLALVLPLATTRDRITRS